MTPERRQQLIDALIEATIVNGSGDGDWFLRELLTHGCRGYAQYTDEELLSEATSNNVEY